jgi:carboxylesterase type B
MLVVFVCFVVFRRMINNSNIDPGDLPDAAAQRSAFRYCLDLLIGGAAAAQSRQAYAQAALLERQRVRERRARVVMAPPELIDYIIDEFNLVLDQLATTRPALFGSYRRAVESAARNELNTSSEEILDTPPLVYAARCRGRFLTEITITGASKAQTALNRQVADMLVECISKQPGVGRFAPPA